MGGGGGWDRTAHAPCVFLTFLYAPPPPLHSAGWTFYSLASTPADPYIFAANLFGSLLGLWYTSEWREEREEREREERGGDKKKNMIA